MTEQTKPRQAKVQRVMEKAKLGALELQVPIYKATHEGEEKIFSTREQAYAWLKTFKKPRIPKGIRKMQTMYKHMLDFEAKDIPKEKQGKFRDIMVAISSFLEK